MASSPSSGRLIVAACPPGSECERILKESDGGIVIPAEDERAFIQAINRVRRGEVDIAEYRRRAREYALRTFDRTAVYGPILQDVRAGLDRALVST